MAPIQAFRVPNGGGLSSHVHGLGHAVEPVLHPVEHVLMSTTCVRLYDAPSRPRGNSQLQTADIFNRCLLLAIGVQASGQGHRTVSPRA